MRPFQRAACILICLGLCLSSPPFVHAAVTSEESKQLLQKGLTVYEIDQELARIERQQQNLNAQQTSTQRQLEQQQALSGETKQHAGRVLRAYYMGDRDSLWMLLFSAGSFKDALVTLEYLQMIMTSDRDALQKHLDNQKKLKELTSELQTSQAELQQAKDNYMAQKERLTALQQQIDADLAKQPNAAPTLLQEMTNLTLQWQEKGAPLFKTYFLALAQAMKQLPELVSASDSGGGKNTHLIMNGFQYTFQITDEELNAFLRAKNPIFQNMSFRFTRSDIIATGRQDDMEVTIKGSYDLAVKNDGKTKFIRFTIQQLQFNGFDLPQSTIDAMMKDFDFGIYPQAFASFLQVTEVRQEEGKLSILLKLAL
ncbi:hypothetical protein [Paenibacillus doosanensis]|uniref:hypothetical protein n=1 Tax=Paenibacillus doosanensis TaxID=1229154 RepID=UPI00217FF572|nr:hypothetical protein [Paenibacillus doosanensis]